MREVHSELGDRNLLLRQPSAVVVSDRVIEPIVSLDDCAGVVTAVGVAIGVRDPPAGVNLSYGAVVSRRIGGAGVAGNGRVGGIAQAWRTGSRNVNQVGSSG